MHKITKDRVVLIRAMVDSIKDLRKLNSEIPENEIAVLETIVQKIRKDENGHFLSLATNAAANTTHVTYSKSADSKFEIQKRVMTSVTRYFSRHYGAEFQQLKDTTADKYQRRIGVRLNIASVNQLDTRIKILRGKEVKNYYKTQAASTSHSCMVGSCKSHIVSLYEMNPDKVGLAVLDNEIRALIWTLDDGSTLLDRVYPAGHGKIDLVRLWAENKGYILRKNADQNIVDKTIELSNGAKQKVTLKHGGIFPFMDTFRYGKLNGNTVVCSNDFDFGDVKFNSDQGIYTEVFRCVKCGEKLQKQREVMNGDTIEYQHICDACFQKMFFACAQCGKNHPLKMQGISGRGGRNYCRRCVTTMQSTIKYSECSCDRCADTKRTFTEILKAGKIDINADMMSGND